MNSPPQLDLHPDADSINALVEQLLTEPERSQILTHLAGCSRCREVVFAAKQALFVMEPEALVAAAAAPVQMVASPAAVRPRSVPGAWRVALIPAAALAAAIAISVFAYFAHTRQASELAKNGSQAAPQAAGIRQQPAAHEKPIPAKPAVASNETKQAASKPHSFGRGDGGPALSQVVHPNQPVPRAPIPSLTTDKNAIMSAPRPLEQQLSAAQFKPAQQTGTPHRVSGTAAGVAANPDKPQTQVEGAAQSNTPNPTEFDTASISQLQVESASQNNSSLIGRRAMGKMVADLKEQPSMLPSGLRATSIVTAQHRTLAVDSLGALFLSTDAGLHWDSVLQQWEGRALVVRTLTIPQVKPPGVGAFDSAQAPKSSAPGAGTATSPSAISPLFEIVTESNHVWVSADGEIWKQKTF